MFQRCLGMEAAPKSAAALNRPSSQGETRTMITVIAIVRAKPGMGPALEADFKDWAAVVKAKEPGTLTYTLSRSREEPELYYALETYADEAAVEAHMANFAARPAGPDLAVGPPKIMVLDKLV